MLDSTIAEVGDCEVDKFFHHIDRCVRVQLGTKKITTLANFRTYIFDCMELACGVVDKSSCLEISHRTPCGGFLK